MLAETEIMDEIQTTTMSITPEMAEEWLRTKNMANRRTRRALVAKYVGDMKAGNWKLSSQGISFDTNGRLIDGQHRLEAVVESGVTVEMRVFTNCPEDIMPVLDTGASRAPADVISIKEGYHVTGREVAIVRNMMLLSGQAARKALTPLQLASILRRYKEAIGWAAGAFPYIKRGVTRAPVLAVIARATYHIEPDVLTAFAKSFFFGFGGEKERAIVGLRDFCMSQKVRNYEAEVELYRKAENVLWHYANDIPLPKVRIATKEMFPLPDEVKQGSREG